MQQCHHCGASNCGVAVAIPEAARKPRIRRRSSSRNCPPNQRSINQAARKASPALQKPLKYGRPEISIAHEIGGNSGEHHANHQGWTCARTKCDQKTSRDP